jgi:hypothetical protein
MILIGTGAVDVFKKIKGIRDVGITSIGVYSSVPEIGNLQSVSERAANSFDRPLLPNAICASHINQIVVHLKTSLGRISSRLNQKGVFLAKH